MGILRIVAGLAAVLVVVGVLGLELAATSLVSRSVRSAVEERVEVDELEVTSVSRPAVLGFLQGEVRDVHITASGVRVGDDLRIDRVDARLPSAPVGVGPVPESLLVIGDVRIVEDDLESYLVARAPDLARPTLAITPDGLEIGDERVPFGLEAIVVIGATGDLRLIPTLGDPRLWSSLGLELQVEVPREIQILAVRFGDGDVVVSGRAEIRIVDQVGSAGTLGGGGEAPMAGRRR
jgi:hypothetical protein